MKKADNQVPLRKQPVAYGASIPADHTIGAKSSAGAVQLHLPASYIFVDCGTHHREWPVMDANSVKANRIAGIKLHERVTVLDVRDKWAMIRLHSGESGWALMTVGSKQHIIPYSPENHRDLKALPSYVGQLKAAPVSQRSGKAPLLSLFFGRRDGPLPRRTQQRPAHNPPCVAARTPTPSKAGSIDRHPTATPTATGVVHGSRSPARVASTKGQELPRVYPWQKRRGTNNQDLYVAKLESRREELRDFDLAEHPVLLTEWMELIRELDVVLRYKFSSQIEQQKDVRKPRSNSFFGIGRNTGRPAASSESTTVDSVATTSRTSSGSEPSTVGDPVRRRRSNSFADPNPRHMIFKQPVPQTSRDFVASVDATSLSSDEKMTESSPVIITSANGTCKHGNKPSECKYGECPELRKKGAILVGAAAAASAENHSVGRSEQVAATCKSCDEIPTMQSEHSTAGIPGAAASKAKLCKHGNLEGNCKYGACAEPAPRSSQKLCKHANDPKTCMYGDCVTARTEKEVFERMVQEELEKLRAERGIGASSVGVHDTNEADNSSQDTYEADMEPILDVRLRANKTGAKSRIPGPAVRDAHIGTGSSNLVSRPGAASINTGQAISTGGKRVVKKKIKRRAVAGSASTTLAHSKSSSERSTSPKRRLVRAGGANSVPETGSGAAEPHSGATSESPLSIAAGISSISGTRDPLTPAEADASTTSSAALADELSDNSVKRKLFLEADSTHTLPEGSADWL